MELAITKERLPQKFTEALNNRIVLNQVPILRNITNSKLLIFTKLQKKVTGKGLEAVREFDYRNVNRIMKSIYQKEFM